MTIQMWALRVGLLLIFLLVYVDSSLKTQKYLEWFKNQSNVTQCEMDLQHFFTALNEQQSWAISMADAFGKTGSGITEGNVVWAGDYNLCHGIVPTPILNSSAKPFNTQYCWLSFNALSRTQKDTDMKIFGRTRLRSSICMPDTCSSENFKKIMHYLLDAIPDVGSASNFTGISCVAKQNFWKDSSLIAPAIICSMFIVLLVLGTIYDCWQHNHRRSQCGYKILINTETFPYADCHPSIKTPTSRDDKSDFNNGHLENQNALKHRPKSIAERVLLSFSVYTNGKNILRLSYHKDDVAVIHGVRFISMSWIILAHTYAESYAVVDTPLAALGEARAIVSLIIRNGVLAVDTFFTLSGFLNAYMFLKYYDKNDGRVSWLRFYVYRLWRLTPPYLLVLYLVFMRFMRYSSNGPYWDISNFIDLCEKKWWWNALYINNLSNINESCMSWTWYLANDMQYYMMSPLLLIPVAKRSLFLTSLIAGFFLLMSIISSGLITFYNGFHLYFFQNSKEINFFYDQYYAKPYTRVGPYIIGMLCGWLMYHCKCRINLKMYWAAAGWIAAASIALTLIIGNGITNSTKAVSSLYFAFGGISWSVSVCWVIFACTTGYGGFINDLLSWPAWAPLSRLTYMAYLFHYILILIIIHSIERPLTLSYAFVILNYLGFLVLSYLGALLLSLAFESPFIKLKNVFFP